MQQWRQRIFTDTSLHSQTLQQPVRNKSEVLCQCKGPWIITITLTKLWNGWIN